MNNNKIIMTVKLFYPVKAEYDIEVSSDITAYDLFVAINNAFSLNYRTDIKEDCYLFAENPVAFLAGDKLLSDYGLRNRTVINVLPRNYSLSGNSYLKDYDFTAITFNCAVDWSSSAMVTIGSDKGCDLLKDTSSASKVKIEIISKEGKIFLQAEKGTTIAYNGKIISFDGNSLQLYPFTFVNIFDCCFYIHGRNIYMDRKYNIRLNRFSCKDINESIGAMNYPKFIRNSRLKLKINDEKIKLLLPKEKPPKPKNNMLLKLMPTVAMIALTILLRGVVGKTNLSFILFSVCSMSMGAIVSFLTIMNDKKEYLQQIQDREQGYRKYIEDKEKEISDMRKEEWQILNRIYYRCNETIAFAKNFSGSLFDRVPEDEDFLEIRIGSGDVDAIRKIDYKPQEKYESDDDELVDLPCNISEKYRKISDAPILLQLKEANVIGVVGTDRHLYEIMKVIYFDLCIRQHYDDVTTFLITDNERCSEYDWIKWFRHINNDKFRNIVCDNQSKATVFEYLYSELDKRACSNEKVHLPHIVVFVMNDFGIKEHPVSKYIEKASLYGATFIFFENHSDYIPLGCSQLVLVDDDTKGRIIKNENTEIVNFKYTRIEDSDLYSISYKLASVYCEEVSLESTLTKNITLYQLLGIKSAEELDIKARWNKSDVTKSMAVPIGVCSGNETVYLDIHDSDKAHGPHGLIAGTTGSGKSEVLMTYILSVATLFSPEEVAFLIIDFKGGGMGNQFKTLPHTLGVITDIDGKGINRSLISIKAEIERRKKLFEDAKVDHINKYINELKSHNVETVLPHLIIIVDEFAELKAQYGDFMSELNSIARVGRSFGVHLILATQKPQGQVDSQIDSNSKFRICLKVQTPSDSQEVIKTPLASEIKEAGRAYLMVGNNEVFELFQSAYSGASADADLLEQQKEFTMSLVDFAGRRLPAFSRKHSDSGNDKKMISQKEAIMARITECFEKSNLKKLPNICQPPLEKVIAYTENPKRAGTGIYADLGIFDDPANQRQENYIVDMSLKHMFITGELQTGKTNILQLIIRTLAEKYTPEEVNFYIIDYSSMILKQFNNLAHVGGVVVQNEEEKMNNLFKLLVTEISERKKKFNKAGVSSYTAYKESGYSDLPLIILMIDNFTSFKELYLNDKIVLKSVLQEGLSAGISVVVTNSSVKGIEYKLISHFTCRIGLHHTNTDEYTNLFNTFRLSVDDIAGRCLVEVDKKTLDCQIYKSFQGEKETDRGKHIEAFVNKINMQYPDRKAMIIPEIPNPLIENDVRSKYFSYFTPYSFILGFDYNSLMPIKMNLSGLNMIIAGTSQPDKTNFIKYMISCINAGIESAPVQIVIFDKATVRKYAGLADKYKCITRYEISTQNMKSICSDWKKELEERKKLVLENNGDMSVLNDKPLLMMIYEDSSKEMLNDFDDSLFNYLPYKFAWMASDVDNDEISSVKAPKLYRAKSAKANFMLFGSARAGNIIDGFISVPLAERNKIMNTEIGEKDALYVNAENKTTVYRIKTILHKE